MKYILAHANFEVLRQFTWSKVLIAFDYDGTLAPIVTDPEQATMRAATRALLDKVTALYPCAVISGRARADVRRMLNGVNLFEVIGNHGVEPWQVSERFSSEVRRWKPILEKRLTGLQGVKIEDKGFSIALHYRMSREKKKARAAIAETAALLGEVRLIPGKQVVNLLPYGAPHKGIALERARARFGCDTAIYVGDDETDEDVFTLDQPGRLLTIRVGPKRASGADYFVSGQGEVDDLLQVLIAMRQNARPRPKVS